MARTTALGLLAPGSRWRCRPCGRSWSAVDLQHHGVQPGPRTPVSESIFNKPLGVLRAGELLLKWWRPKPLWMHWFRMPPSSLSRSTMRMSSQARLPGARRRRPGPPGRRRQRSDHTSATSSSFRLAGHAARSPARSCTMSSMGTFRSRARISITRGPQKPPWQRPMPALTRRLTPSTERGGMGPRDGAPGSRPR